jgi:hypothetical protein
MRHLLLILLCLSGIKLNAQIVYLDSANKHFLRFDSLDRKHFPAFAVREYYGEQLLSLGKTEFIPDDNYIDYLKTTNMTTIRQLWSDTIITFDLYGDTLSYFLIKKRKTIFSVKYANNRRTELSLFEPKRIDYLYFDDGSIEKYYRKRKMYKLVLVKNNQSKIYTRSLDLYQTPYYSESDKVYYNFDVNEFSSANLSITCTSIPLGNHTYKVTYNNNGNREQNIDWSIHRRMPFFKRLRLSLFGKQYRYSDRTRLLYQYRESPNYIEEVQLDRREHLIKHNKTYLNDYSDYNGSNRYHALSTMLNDHVFRYSADSFKGYIALKRHSFVHVDSFKHGKYLDITNGIFKDSIYRYTTYRNGQIYRKGYAYLYYTYQHPKSLDRYDNNGMNLNVADEVMDILHSTDRFNDADTIFANKDTQIIQNYYKIKLKTLTGEKILFDSFYVYGEIVKDQSLCAMGVKGSERKWIIPPSYDHITQVSIIDQLINGYYVAINDYGAIYNQKGRLLIPPIRGLSYEKVKLPDDHSAQYHYNQYAFICNDFVKDSFKLIDAFNKVVMKGAGKYTIFRNKALIKHKGRMQFPHLNTEKNILWFKDTIIGMGSDFIILEEMDNNKASGQLRLLNTKIDVLHPEIFKYFYKEQYLVGLVSDRRKIVLSGARQYFEDSSGIAYDAVNHNSNYLILKNKNLYGLVEDNKLILPPEYDGIQVSHLLILAHKDSTSYLFDREGKLIKNIGQMATYYKRQDGFLELPYGDYLTEDEKESVMIVKDHGLWGIMNNKGELLLPCIYEDIHISSPMHVYGNLYTNEKLSIQTLSKEKVIQAWEFKNGRAIEVKYKEPVLFFHSVTNQDYLGYYGQKAIEKRSFIERKVLPINNSIFQFVLHNDNDSSLREKRYSRPIGGGNIAGLMDYNLKWIVRFDTFSEVRAEQNFYYVRTKQNLCGVLGSDYRYIVPPTYPYIYYDALTGLLWHKNNSNGYWKIRHLDKDIDLPDSFDYPVKFERNDTRKPVSKFGYFGMLNMYGQIFIPMIYDRISESTHSQVIVIAMKNKQYYVQDQYSGNMMLQPYNKLYTSSNSQNYIPTPEFGLNGNQLYNLKYFKATDSSKQLFLDLDNEFPFNSNVYYNKLEPGNASNKEIYLKKKKLLHLALNTSIDFIMWWHSPAPDKGFPESRNNYSYPVELTTNDGQLFKGKSVALSPIHGPEINGDWRQFNEKRDTLPTIQTPTVKDARINVEDIVGKRLSYYNEDLNTISFRSLNRYLNVCFDSTGQAYNIVLEDIIAPELKDSFSYFLRSLWLKIETPSLPCIQQNQIFDFLNNGFVFRERKLIFLPDRLNISITRDELRPFLKPEWAARIL